MSGKTEKVRGKYTKSSMLFYFLRGSVHFFIISILSAFLVTLAEMLMPQLIRFTVDSVIGSAEPDLPGFFEHAAPVLWRCRVSQGTFAYYRIDNYFIGGFCSGL